MAKETKEKESNSKEEENIEQNNEAASTEDDSQEQIEILKEELAEAQENLLRERADFTNFRKRTIQEKADIQSYATSQVLQELLPAIDSFDQLIATREAEGEEADMTKFLDGVALIQKQVLDGLGKFGVEIYNPENEEFDPNSMEALSRQESGDVDKDIVSQVYQKGYKISGKIIRAARVGVLTRAEKAEKPDENSAGSDNEEGK